MNEESELMETRLWTRCLHHDSAGELRQFDDRLATTQNEERCLRRAVCLMFAILLVAFGGAGHSAVLLKEASPYTMHVLMYGCSTFAIASFISLLVFGVLWIARRNELADRRDDCRRAALRLISMVASPVTGPNRQPATHVAVTSVAPAVPSDSTRLLNPPAPEK